MKQTTPGEPATLESHLRQIIREEVRAALLDWGAGAVPPDSPVGVAANEPARNPLALKPEDVSEMTGVPVQTLSNWRSETLHGKPVGPRSFKMGRLVRYTEADVNAWLKGLPSK